MFATPQSVNSFRLPNRLVAIVEVSDRLHLKPLLRSITFPNHALVMALSQNGVRVIEISEDGDAAEVRVADMPTDIANASGKASITDRSPIRRLQGSEGQKVRMVQYSRQVDHALRPLVTGHTTPLILAATEPLDAIYRSVSSYPHLAAESINGTPTPRRMPTLWHGPAKCSTGCTRPISPRCATPLPTARRRAVRPPT